MALLVLCFVWLLWPLLSLMGGLGFAPLTGLAAVPLGWGFIRRFRPRWYMLPLVLFFIYAFVSGLWSPNTTVFDGLDFTTGSISVKNQVFRVAPQFLALGVLISAVLAMGDKQKRRLATFARWALLAQMALVTLVVMFQDQVVELVMSIGPDAVETRQNVSRNSIMMAVAAPALIAMLAHGRSIKVVWMATGCVVALEAAILFVLGTDAGILSLLVAGVCIAVVYMVPIHGFRVLGVMFALIVMAAPVAFGALSAGANAEEATTSAQWRLAIWDRAMDVIVQHPVFGAGLGALRVIKEEIQAGVLAGQLYMPNHPHNMALQLWAETGFVGAALLSAVIVLAAWRMPPPRSIGRTAFQAAGLAGGVLSISLVSFDLWNAPWWALTGILAALTGVSIRAAETAKAEAAA